MRGWGVIVAAVVASRRSCQAAAAARKRASRGRRRTGAGRGQRQRERQQRGRRKRQRQRGRERRRQRQRRVQRGRQRRDAGRRGSCLGASFLECARQEPDDRRRLDGGGHGGARRPFDLQYEYISGGLPDGSGPCASCASGCTTQRAPRARTPAPAARGGAAGSTTRIPRAITCAPSRARARASRRAQIPMITYYQLLQSSGVTEGAPEVTQAATERDVHGALLRRLALPPAADRQGVALLHIEPDFWGYAEQQSEDPTSLTAAVASANATDCASMPNTIAGMGQCMIAMMRKYAPHALVGAARVGLGDERRRRAATRARRSTWPAWRRRRRRSSRRAARAAPTSSSSRRATATRATTSRSSKNTWWDATNATLPDFHQDFA